MPAALNPADLKRALSSLYTIYNDQGDSVYLAQRHEEGIQAALQAYVAKFDEYEFVGLGHQAFQTSHLVIDQAVPNFWVLNTPATAGWGVNVPTAQTTVNLFPTDTQRIRQTGNIVWWEYIMGFLDCGINNSLTLLDFAEINGKQRAIVRANAQVWGAGMRFIELDPGLLVGTQGTKNIDAQFNNPAQAAQTVIIPLAVEILPFEIATSQDVTTYVTEVA